MKKDTVAFVIGRFQPFHNGHKALIDEALKTAEHVIVFVGSVQESRTKKNPYTYGERRAMLLSEYKQKITVSPLPDAVNDKLWVDNIKKQFVDLGYQSSNAIFVCCNKDDATTISNDLLIDFEKHIVDQPSILNATDIRRQIYEEGFNPLHLATVPVQTRLIISYLNLTLKPVNLIYKS